MGCRASRHKTVVDQSSRGIDTGSILPNVSRLAIADDSPRDASASHANTATTLCCCVISAFARRDNAVLDCSTCRIHEETSAWLSVWLAAGDSQIPYRRIGMIQVENSEEIRRLALHNYL